MFLLLSGLNVEVNGFRQPKKRVVSPFRPGETTRVSVLEFVLELSLEEFFLIMKKSLESV